MYSPPRKVFYGWWLLAGSVVAMALASGVSFWSFGLYIDPLEEDFGWSRAEVSLGFSIALALSGLSGPLIGRWIDTRGARSAIFVGACLTALTYLLLATTSQLWQWYVYLSLNAVFRGLMFFIPFQVLISRWFDKRRGLALGILGTGFSMGGFAVVPLMRLVIDSLGWQSSFVFSGLVTFGFFIPLAWLLVRNEPAEVGGVIDGGPELRAGAEARPMGGLTAAEAVRTPLFWSLAVALMLMFFGMFGWLVHQVPFYESVGISRPVAASLVAVSAAIGIISRLTFGVLADRIKRIEFAAAGLVAFLIAGTLTLLIDTGPAGISISLAFWIVGTGGGPLLEPMLMGRAFGLANFGGILGTLILVETVGIVVSPVLAGAIFDATDSYNLVLVIFLVAFAASFAFFNLAGRLAHPLAERTEIVTLEQPQPA